MGFEELALRLLDFADRSVHGFEVINASYPGTTSHLAGLTCGDGIEAWPMGGDGRLVLEAGSTSADVFELGTPCAASLSGTPNQYMNVYNNDTLSDDNGLITLAVPCCGNETGTKIGVGNASATCGIVLATDVTTPGADTDANTLERYLAELTVRLEGRAEPTVDSWHLKPVGGTLSTAADDDRSAYLGGRLLSAGGRWYLGLPRALFGKPDGAPTLEVDPGALAGILASSTPPRPVQPGDRSAWQPGDSRKGGRSGR